MDPNIIIPAAIAAAATVLVAAINWSSKRPVVATETEHDDKARERLIQSLSEALLHCLNEHRGTTA